MARWKFSERQAQDICDLRLGQLTRLDGIKLNEERKSLQAERDEFNRVLGSDRALRGVVIKELEQDAKKYGDERRTAIESAERASIERSVVVEPLTVILSQRGWIRAMKGHVELGDVEQLKWREGDGPFIHFHAQTTDRIALFADNGRVYTLAGDRLPGGRGFGEPVRLQIDLEPEVDIVNLLAIVPGMKLLVASSDGRGFLASGEATLAETRKGRQLVNLRPGAKLSVVRPVPEGADSVAVVGENRKLLVFALSDLPELARGQGVTLQRYRDGGLAEYVIVPSPRLTVPLDGLDPVAAAPLAQQATPLERDVHQIPG